FSRDWSSDVCSSDLKAEGDQLPAWVEAWIADGNESFYKRERGNTFYVHQQRYVLQEQEEGVIELARIKEEKGTVWSNREASLIDRGDGVEAREREEERRGGEEAKRGREVGE